MWEVEPGGSKAIFIPLPFLPYPLLLRFQGLHADKAKASQKIVGEGLSGFFGLSTQFSDMQRTNRFKKIYKIDW